MKKFMEPELEILQFATEDMLAGGDTDNTGEVPSQTGTPTAIGGGEQFSYFEIE